MNKELVPFFGDNLYIDYENPIPEDETQLVTNAVNLFKSKIITRNDALEMVNMEPLDTPEGEEYFTETPSFGQSFGQEQFQLPAKTIKLLDDGSPKA